MDGKSIIIGELRPELITEETLVDLFNASAQLYANKTALIFKNKFLTYQELDRWSDAFAAYLTSKGIGRGNSVGIWYKRGIELHVAIIGIIKCGAAYVPMDIEMPADRVRGVLAEVEASAIISSENQDLGCPKYDVIEAPSAEQIIEKSKGPLPDDRAYVLYTSGSTGKPKGIPISQRQITHLVKSEQQVLKIQADDRVYQGFSVSFDMWCEESWISYAAGASIWVADATTAKSIDEIAEVLRRENISILHAVPSLLAIIDDDIPSLRLVNAGGEACTQQVLARWGTPERRFFNSYGPTETTVTATMAELKADDKITIGKPLPNYNLAVVDEKMNPVPFGEKGELVISGPGVCNGYINREDLTKEKFVLKPESLAEMPGDKIYRTGDAAVINADSSIDFHGRLDDQIKLRGFRIELGEIETKLNQLEGISAAAVAVKKDNNLQDQLVGYVLLEDLTEFNEALLRTELAKSLPVYMVPAIIVSLPEMPRLPSGKIDRKSLPLPDSLKNTQAENEQLINVNDSVKDKVLLTLNKVFPNRKIDLEQDFFTDLGGHSLLAAVFVSRLRNEAYLPKASLKDVYLHRPLKNLIIEWEKKSESKKKEKEKFNTVPLYRYYLCGFFQTIALIVIFGLFAIQIFLPYLGYYYVEQDTGHLGYAIATSLCLFCLIPPFFSLISILTKWLIIGKMKEGDYPLWGAYYFKWWFAGTLQRLMPQQFLTGTPLYNIYLRMMGAKIAPDAQISAITIGAEDLVTIGKDVSLSSQVILNNAVVENGLLKLRKIEIKDHAYIGSSAIIAGGSTIEAWGELQDLSYLPAGKVIGEREIWKGSPAACIGKRTVEELTQPLEISKKIRNKYSFIFLLLLLLFPFVILLPLLPTIIIINKIDNALPEYDFSYLVITPLLSLSYILLFAFVTVMLTRILQKGIKPGKYPIYSRFYLKKWFADQLMNLSLIVLHPIYATVYVSTLFRALGAKIGKRTEISTASSVTHPLLEIGKESFIADAVTLGESDVRGQQLILDKTIIGNSSFVGNSALIPQGYNLPSHMLIGVLSTPPTEEQLANQTERNWFGSPAIALPKRQESHPYSLRLTTFPTFGRRMARSLIELFRVLLPETIILCCSILFIAYGHDLLVNCIWWQIILELPFYYLFFMGVPAFLVTVLLKWVFVGKYKTEHKPMWTSKVWRSEAVTNTYEALAVPFFLWYLQGTFWLPLALKLMGVKTGKRIYMNTTDITEHDMVSIGDDTAMNEDCGPQTHLFEDRVMKVGRVTIGKRTSIGARSIILYDSIIEDDVQLDALSLVMKGETLHLGSTWNGSPVRPS